MPFKHAPLDASQEQIRLIEVESTARESPIRCQIRHVSLQQVHYTALSYVWGSSDHPQIITLNEEPFATTKNLHDFLETVQNDFTRPMFWIDALCIDQTNLDERAEQVRLMSKIYAHAQQVWVWLGILPVSRAFLSEVFNVSEPSFIRDASERARYKMQEWRKQGNEEWLDVVQLLRSHEYWSRVWIAQEFVLSNNMQIYSEGQLIPGDHFQTMVIEAANMNRAYPSRPIRMEIRNSRCWYLCKERHEWLNIRELVNPHPPRLPIKSLRKALIKYGIADCKEWRDKIYGFLSLAPDGHKLTIDYAIDKIPLLMNVLHLETDTPIWYIATYARLLIRYLNITDSQLLHGTCETVSRSKCTIPFYSRPSWQHFDLMKEGFVGRMPETHPAQFVILSGAAEFDHYGRTLCECWCDQCRSLPLPKLHLGDEIYLLPPLSGIIRADRHVYLVLRWKDVSRDRFECVALADRVVDKTFYFRRIPDPGTNYIFEDRIHVHRDLQNEQKLWLTVDQQTLLFLLRNHLLSGRGPDDSAGVSGWKHGSPSDKYYTEDLDLAGLQDLNLRLDRGI